jgi:hypothetical protein
MFTSEAKIRHAQSKWDHKTRQVFSADEYVVDELLAEDDEYNKTDEPTAEKVKRCVIRDESHIQFHTPIVIDPETFPKMYDDNDSVSTFHRDTNSVPVNLAPSTKFTPQISPKPPTTAASSTCNAKPVDIDYQEHDESVSKLSDTQSRISTLESDIKHLNHSFKNAISELKLQSKQQVKQQQMHESTLAKILALLKQSRLPSDDTSVPSVRDNLPDQSTSTGGSSGAAGSG